MVFTSLLLLCAVGGSLTSATCWNNSARLRIEQLNPTIPTRNGEFNVEKLVTGPRYQLGDYSDCLDKLEAQYCLIDIQLSSSDNSSQLWQRIQESNSNPANFRRDKLLVGICVPKQCSNLDVINGFEETLSAAAQNLGVTATVNVNEQDCQTNDRRPYTTIDVIVGFVLGSIILLVLCGSTYDGYRRLQKYENQGQTTGGSLLVCFSLFTNLEKLGARRNTDDSKAFQSIEAIRFVGTFILVFVHAVIWTCLGPIQNTEYIEKTLTSTFWNIARSSHALVSVYLSISGFLTSYFFIREVNVRGSIGLSEIAKAFGLRYVRLTPAYAVMVALQATWFSHLGTGPMWNRIVGTEIENCRQNWWINLLYLNNYIDVPNMCLRHSWYLAADFQCFATSILVLMLVWKYPRFAKMTLGAVMMLWVLVPFIQTYVERLDPTILLYLNTSTHFWHDKTFIRMYVTLQGSAGAYFAGVIFGYIYYHARHSAMKRSRLMYAVFCSIVLTLPWILTVTGSIFYRPTYKYNVLTASLYACAFRTVTGIGVAVLVTGTAVGYGRIVNSIATWRPFQVFGKLTYTIYLTHFCLQNAKTGAVKVPIYISNFSLFRNSLSDLIIATVLALLLWLSVEMPIYSIVTRLILSGNFNQKAKPSNKNTTNNKTEMQMAPVEQVGANISQLSSNVRPSSGDVIRENIPSQLHKHVIDKDKTL